MTSKIKLPHPVLITAITEGAVKSLAQSLGYVGLMDQDARDILASAGSHLSVTRCVGDRLTTSGYVCVHCPSDQPSGAYGYCVSRGVYGSKVDPADLPKREGGWKKIS